MKLVVDANVLFSAAIRDSKTAELIIDESLSLHAPEYLFDEFEKHSDTVLEKTHRDSKQFERFMQVLRQRIRTVPSDGFADRLPKARSISPDPDDAVYFALALHLGAPIWTDDKRLRQQDSVEVYSTTKMVEEIG